MGAGGAVATGGGERVPPLVVDALLGAAVAMAIALIVAADQGGDRPPDAVAYLFALGFGALVPWRRRAPLVVLWVTVLAMFAYYTFEYPPIGVALPVAAALFSAADAGRTGWAVVAGVVVLVVSIVFRLEEGTPVGLLLGYEAVSNTALIAAATALGSSVRGRRIQAAQQAEITRLTAQAVARETEARMRRERERISRDLHDTVGHTMAVISLQAGVAAEAIGDGHPVAGEAVEKIRTAAGHTLREVRSMVRVLRAATGSEPAPAPPVLSLAALPDLVGPVREAGVAVTTLVDVDPAALPPPVDAAAYRVLQEALTNVVRHSGARRARVRARLRGGELHLTVVDDGRGASESAPVAGHGLTGMGERVRLLGGVLRTRSGPGFAVHARIPVGEAG
ncbi:sensor histidine kinase [Pseudonocardia humida]|uniref:histidine kinase n=1 Tax=Pseudonocardia humida TaxID=2800819 RepID=A0ABT1ABA3_9PSEU|nr:histidine kinase [Pseudonocardia humida]MCO1660213.1 sensor histidine kinase [Pseudonocardia humida]